VYRTLDQGPKGSTKTYDALLYPPAGCLHYSRRRWARQVFICCFLSLQLLIVALHALGFRTCRRTLEHVARSPALFCYTVQCFLEGTVSERVNYSTSPFVFFAFISLYSISPFFLTRGVLGAGLRHVMAFSLFLFLTVIVMGGLGWRLRRTLR